jgi:uncharacterized membrane protein HdeD (DUF308 family)
MLDLPAPSLAAMLGISLPEWGIVIGIIAVLGGIPIAIAALYFRHQQQKLWHETARLALEKGQPLPPQSAEDSDRQSSTHDFRSGLILMAVGAGLYFFLGRGIAFIVGFTGAALVFYAIVIAILKRKNPPHDPPARS